MWSQEKRMHSSIIGFFKLGTQLFSTVCVHQSSILHITTCHRPPPRGSFRRRRHGEHGHFEQGVPRACGRNRASARCRKGGGGRFFYRGCSLNASGLGSHGSEAQAGGYRAFDFLVVFFFVVLVLLLVLLLFLVVVLVSFLRREWGRPRLLS